MAGDVSAAGAQPPPVLVRAIAPRAREVQLNRPGRANALGPDMVAALTAAVASAYADETRMLVFRGAGRHFCGGFDRSSEGELAAGDRIGSALAIEALLQLIWRAPFVTVALLQGAAIGAGADLAISCDYRLAGPAAKFAFPGFRLMGVSLGTRRLAELIGGAAAFDMALHNRQLDRDAALALGLATHAEDPEAFDGFVAGMAESVAAVGKQSIAVLREATRGGGSGSADLERVARSIAWAQPAPG